MPNDPIDRIEWVHVDELKANFWNPNIVHDQEMRLLETSLLLTGWVQPILISRDGIIVDGFHRWCLSKSSTALQRKYGGLVPCARLDIGEDAAMALTVRINRAKGTHVAVRMSHLVKALIDTHCWDRQQVAKEIGATLDEVDLLYQDSIFKARNLSDYRYSKAWTPHEDGR